jgi:hypothetical protein
MPFDGLIALVPNTVSARTNRPERPIPLPVARHAALRNEASGRRYIPRLFEASNEAGKKLLFEEAVSALLADTEHQSAMSLITHHPKFAVIVDIGEDAAKMILERIAAGEIRVHWFPALKRITRADPVPPQSRGLLGEMAQAWLDWGRREHLLAA